MNSQFMDGKRHTWYIFLYIMNSCCINFVKKKESKVSVWNDNNVFWNENIYKIIKKKTRILP